MLLIQGFRWTGSQTGNGSGPKPAVLFYLHCINRQGVTASIASYCKSDQNPHKTSKTAVNHLPSRRPSVTFLGVHSKQVFG